VALVGWLRVGWLLIVSGIEFHRVGQEMVVHC